MADAMMMNDRRTGALPRLFAGMEPFAEAGPLTLREMPVAGQIDLRGDPADTGFVEAAASVLGCALPLAPNTVARAAEVSVLWLGPDEWLVLAAPGAEAGLVAGLQEAIGGRHCAVVDVTGNRTVFRLSGEPARDVLAKGCGLDLHPRVFAPGQCAQTLVARAGVILAQIDDAPTFDILPRRSFGEYVWRWLVDAMEEFR